MANKKPEEQTTPPPRDPYVTYQTPYPPSSSSESEENPFIAFRRFADSQISSLLSSVAGLPSIFSQSPASGRWADLEGEMTRRRQELEEGWRKQWEQEREEGKQEWEKAKRWTSFPVAARKADADAKDEGLANINDFVSDIVKMIEGVEKSLGQEISRAANDANEIPTSRTQTPKPFEKCPALREAGTELDVYESAFKWAMEKGKKPETRYWPDGFDKLSGLGFDGKQRFKIKKQSYCSNGKDEAVQQATTHTFRTTRRFDPVSNSDHILPWLLTSPYSPVYIANPSQPRLAKVELVDEPMVPFQLFSPLWADRYKHPVADELARKLSWADAFEDLVSLEQTGKMVDRDHSTWKTPKTWIHDMVARGSLGPRWGFDDEHRLIKRDLSVVNDSWPSADAVQYAMKRVQETEKENVESLATPKIPSIAAVDLTASQSSSEVLENGKRKMEVQKEINDATRTHVALALEGVKKVQENSLPKGWQMMHSSSGRPYYVDHNTRTTTWDRPLLTEKTDASSSVSKSAISTISIFPEDNSEASSSNSSVFSTPASSWSSTSDQNTDTTVSTLTTTERRTLADGSIEIKKVSKKTFADGREESNESVEVKKAPTSTARLEPATKDIQNQSPILKEVGRLQEDKQTQTFSPTPQAPRKGGWFWN